MDVDEKLNAVQKSSVCRLCLNFHERWTCKAAKECGINNCRLKHHSLLYSSAGAYVAVFERVDSR